MSSKTRLQRDKIDLTMLKLEKLKEEVASIEAKYRILNGHYTIICDEALMKINDARSSFKENGEPVISELGQGDAVKPELETGVKNYTLPEDIDQDYCARQQDEVINLELTPNSKNCAELEDIHINCINHRHDTGQKKLSRQQRTSAIDYVANYIEIGLDKIGDGLVFPFVITARLYKKITGGKSSE